MVEDEDEEGDKARSGDKGGCGETTKENKTETRMENQNERENKNDEEPGEKPRPDPSPEDISRIRTKLLLRRARARSELGGWAELQGAMEG